MKKNIFIVLLAMTATISTHAVEQSSVTIKSPDKHIIVSINNTDNRLSYYVTASDGTFIIQPSRLGLTVDGKNLGDDTKIMSVSKTKKINGKYSILGNHSEAVDKANETTIGIESNSRIYNIFVRAYNDGIAIRYSIPQGTKRIDSDNTSWTLTNTAEKIAWADFNQSYEGLSHITALNDIPENKTIMGPLTVKCGNLYMSFSEADCENFSDMAFTREGSTFKACFPFAKDGWEIKRLADNNPSALNGLYNNQNVSPWRTIIIAKNLTELINSDLLTNLCPAPSNNNDYSWVKPGRCLWQWWSIGAPRYEDQKNWYDAAVKLKWEYYLIDEGWSWWHNGDKDKWTLLKEAIDYGKSVGIRTIVWADSKEFRKADERRKYLEKVKAAGADGIKIDFIPDATSDIMQWYMGTMQDCAELKLLLNFHGSVKPTGLSRTYPNNITREAVRGDEYHMTRYHRVMPLDQDVSLPFTRPMAGAADVTPVMLDPVQLTTAKYSWAHEFAQAIVFLSPITHFCDQYKFYLESPMFDLFQELPTVWDETKVLSCTEMGKVVAYARRRGDVWWIGVMNGADEREINISLDFIKGSRQATLIYDDKTINTAIDRHEQKVTAKDVLNVTLKPAGGFVARIR